MDITEIIYPQFIRSDKDTHFTGALATNALETESFGDLRVHAGEIVSVNLQSDQNLDWDIFFFGTTDFNNADLDSSIFLGRVRFAAADGVQIAGSGQFFYDTCIASAYAFRPFFYVDKTWLDLDDEDKLDRATNPIQLHVGLVNRSATSKNAGATGEVVINVEYHPFENHAKQNII